MMPLRTGPARSRSNSSHSPLPAKPNRTGGSHPAVAVLGDIDRLKPALAEFLKTGNGEHAGFEALGLQPVAALAATIGPAEALRDYALGTHFADLLKQVDTAAYHMADIDDAITGGFREDLAQQRLAMLDRAAPQIVAVEIQQIESEISQALRAAAAECVGQCVEMRHAALVWNRDLAIHDDRMTGCRQGTEGIAKQPRPINAVAAQELQRPAPGDDRDEAMPIVLDRMQPAVAVRRLCAVRYDLEADICRHAGRHRRGMQRKFRHRIRQDMLGCDPFSKSRLSVA
jgi:hypothetical protein